MSKVKIGIVGCGNMGSSHAGSLLKLDGVELTAVCDINPAAFKRLPKEYGDRLQLFTSSEKFFAESGCELVIIAVPHYDHPDLAIAAMNAGMHFILEKPVCVHKAEAERLLAECAKHPELVKAAMFNQRTRNAHRKLKELIDSGELGKINRINWIITDWFRTQFYYDSGDWRASWRGEGGGVLTNQCPHQLDLMQWLFGMPSKVTAHVKFGKYHDVEVEDEVNAYLEYENGAVANFITTTGEHPGTNRLEIAAEQGRVVFENGKITYRRNRIQSSQFIRESKSTFAAPEVWDIEIPVAADVHPTEHSGIIANVVAAIRDGVKLLSPVEEGIRGLELGNAMMLSGWRGESVTLPIDSAEYAARLQELIRNSRYVKKEVVASDAPVDMSGTFGK
ncbi:MAG: Gfo/Idh/MocA family oxidoreductase [Victivallales bacterium]|nr:Gfo/Idh/MocA family oxidoreductase [Victivallales bacterium]